MTVRRDTFGPVGNIEKFSKKLQMKSLFIMCGDSLRSATRKDSTSSLISSSSLEGGAPTDATAALDNNECDELERREEKKI